MFALTCTVHVDTGTGCNVCLHHGISLHTVFALTCTVHVDTGTGSNVCLHHDITVHSTGFSHGYIAPIYIPVETKRKFDHGTT